MNKEKTTTFFLVVDDHPIFRQGIVSLAESRPGYCVCGEVGSMQEAQDFLDQEEVDIVLVDLSLNNENGLELVRFIKDQRKKLVSLVISMHDELIYAEKALEAGARGYVMKQEPPAVILKAIETVLCGKIYVSNKIKDRMLEVNYLNKKEDKGIGSLSCREIEVLEYLGQGYSVSEIAEILHIAVKTVNTYRDHVKEKLFIDSASAVRRFAIKWYQGQHR